MKAICGKCKARVNVNTQEVKTNTIRFKCPVCNTVNKLDLNKAKGKNKTSSEETSVNAENINDITGWLVIHDENTLQQTVNTTKTG